VVPGEMGGRLCSPEPGLGHLELHMSALLACPGSAGGSRVTQLLFALRPSQAAALLLTTSCCRMLGSMMCAYRVAGTARALLQALPCTQQQIVMATAQNKAPERASCGMHQQQRVAL
jgi:hypothetical protein